MKALLTVEYNVHGTLNSLGGAKSAFFLTSRWAKLFVLFYHPNYVCQSSSFG